MIGRGQILKWLAGPFSPRGVIIMTQGRVLVSLVYNASLLLKCLR